MTNQDLAKLEEPEQGLEEYRWDWEICMWSLRTEILMNYWTWFRVVFTVERVKNDEITHDGED